MEVLPSIVEIGLPLLLIMDPVGNGPVFISLLHKVPARRRNNILFREMFFALVLILVFHFLGEQLLSLLDIQQSTLHIGGGLILFIISLKMVFPPPYREIPEIQDKEPFIVPMAVPLIAGPSLLAVVMLNSHRQEGQLVVISATILAWALTYLVLFVWIRVGERLGERVRQAGERLMGLLLIFLSVAMLEKGIRMFLLSLE